MDPEGKKLSILMPVRNEGLNIVVMLKVLNALLKVPSEMLIIYDDKNDDSINAVDQADEKYDNVILVHNKLGKGIINALKSGIN